MCLITAHRKLRKLKAEYYETLFFNANKDEFVENLNPEDFEELTFSVERFSPKECLQCFCLARTMDNGKMVGWHCTLDKYSSGFCEILRREVKMP